MSIHRVIALSVCLLAAATSAAVAQERLSLDQAIQLAVENNRQLQIVRLDVEKAEAELAIARTRRLPVFETNVLSSYLLTPVSFAFPQGAFGEIPGVGPFPTSDVDVKTERAPTAFAMAQMSQPLSQLHRIGLSIRGAAASRDIERERVRAQQLALVNTVKRQYFAILQTQSAVTATTEAITLYRELDRTMQQRLLQKVALRSDAMDVQVRLAEQELTQTTQANSLATQKEQLNQTLGRDVRTPFEVADIAPMPALAVDLDAAHTRALAQRPDIGEARLTLQSAELAERIEKAQRIPDVSLAVSYTTNANVDVLPRNLATVGVQFKWEPFDWGRRGRQVAEKTMAVQQAKHAVREYEDRAVIEVNNLYRKLSEASARLRVTEASQQAVREKLRVTTNQYQIQAALLSDVLNVRAQLSSMDDTYQQALLAFWTAKADFDHAVGEEGLR
jgi:outer membrane protein TolC